MPYHFWHCEMIQMTHQNKSHISTTEIRLVTGQGRRSLQASCKNTKETTTTILWTVYLAYELRDETRARDFGMEI